MLPLCSFVMIVQQEGGTRQFKLLKFYYGKIHNWSKNMEASHMLFLSNCTVVDVDSEWKADPVFIVLSNRIHKSLKGKGLPINA